MSTNLIELPGSGARGDGLQQVVADNLAAELARKRISGRSAARALGFTQAYVARRVSGEIPLDVNDLFSFSRLLGIDPSVLLNAETPHPGNPNGGSVVGPAGIEPTTSTV